MPLRKVFHVDELEEVHKSIIRTMIEDRAYPATEIKELLDHNSSKAIDSRALSRYLDYLERKNYIEKDSQDSKAWRKIRDVPLALEVLDAKIYEGSVSSRMEALWAFYLEHLEEDRPLYDKYARAYKSAIDAKRMVWTHEQEARQTMKKIRESRRRGVDESKSQQNS